MENNNRVWGEYDRYGYRVFRFVAEEVPAGHEEATGEHGEEQVYFAGNSPWESTAVFRGPDLRRALSLEKIAAKCAQTAEQMAEEYGLRYAGSWEVNEDDPDEDE